MYRSCLVCRSDLGENSEVARFPVGTRIAFSPTEGRLWAICERCGEWNLAPIEARWEAVDECEGLYETALRRGSTEGLAMAQLGDLRLLRVGDRSDLPTLRYAGRLRQRSRRHKWRHRARSLTDHVLVLGFSTACSFVMGLNGFFLGIALGGLAVTAWRGRPGRLVAEVTDSEGQPIPITERVLREARLVPTDDRPDDASTDEGPPEKGWSLRLRRGLELDGEAAVQALRVLTPLMNRSDHPEELLGRALRYIEKKGGTLDSVFAAAARRRGRRRTARVANLDPHIRLAIEMLAGAETEARALSADLAPLVSAWKSAESLARIQDDLAFELGVVERIQRSS